MHKNKILETGELSKTNRDLKGKGLSSLMESLICFVQAPFVILNHQKIHVGGSSWEGY